MDYLILILAALALLGVVVALRALWAPRTATGGPDIGPELKLEIDRAQRRSHLSDTSF